ncbi:MAG: hypothetical protein JXQ65_07550 [Candidatus Marinimicrobia bacterium]|nr:hypothetical protein [Candidatus Neomarinimicrobiota bacterium]
MTNLVERIPKSFEIYENPKGQVFLRKKSNSFIRESEMKLFEKLISENTDFDHFYINCQNNVLTLYLPDFNLEDISGMLNITVGNDEINLNRFDPGILTYSPYINIIFDKKENCMTLEKIDNDDTLKRWHIIDSSDDLESLILKNIQSIKSKTYSNLKILFL